MLFYSPEITKALDWFRWTHTVTDHGWVRSSLPRSGGLSEQDARTMLLLEELRAAANELFSERIDNDKRSREITSWRASREHERRGKS